MATTSIALERNPACQVKPLLLSNHAIPTQRWSAIQASQSEVEAIKKKLSSKVDLNGDDVPEFFYPSSDGMDAWLYQLFPTVNRELKLRKGAQ